MRPSDPSREPMLERAMPADAVPGSTIPEDSEAEVLLRDSAWIWCQATGRRRASPAFVGDVGRRVR